ncbi:MAG: trigger factor [Bdellovibrionales bacterium]|nr:trigger factor [Bdellovibrionales bacterium]
MNIHVDSITEVKKKLTITIEDAHVKEHIDEAYKTLQKSASLPGFRKGKTPRTMLEKKFGSQVQAEVYQELMRESMTKALEEKELDAITIFDVSKPEHKEGKGLTYSASVEIRPAIKLKNYKGITVTQNKDEVSEESVQDVLTRIQDSHAVMKPIEATQAKKDQYASITIERLDKDGKTIDEKTPSEQLHLVGHESAHKDIDKAVASLKVNESKEVLIKDDHKHDHKHDDNCNHEDFTVRVTLKGVKEKEVPAIDDAFAKTVGPFKNLDELKGRIKEDLASELEERKKVNYATQILDDLRKNHPAPYPESMLEMEMQNLRQDFFNRVVQSGQRLPEDFSAEKMNEELKPEAERRVHEQVILAAIAKEEKIDVDQNDLEAKIQELSYIYQKPAKELVAELQKNNRIETLRNQILTQKTLDFLLAQANIK